MFASFPQHGATRQNNKIRSALQFFHDESTPVPLLGGCIEDANGRPEVKRTEGVRGAVVVVLHFLLRDGPPVDSAAVFLNGRGKGLMSGGYEAAEAVAKQPLRWGEPIVSGGCIAHFK